MSQDILVSAMITSKITSKAQTTTTPQPVRAALRVARATSSLIGSRVTTWSWPRQSGNRSRIRSPRSMSGPPKPTAAPMATF